MFTAHYFLLTVLSLLLPAHCFLFSALCLLLLSLDILLPAPCSLLSCYCSLLIAHYLMLTAHCWVVKSPVLWQRQCSKSRLTERVYKVIQQSAESFHTKSHHWGPAGCVWRCESVLAGWPTVCGQICEGLDNAGGRGQPGEYCQV